MKNVLLTGISKGLGLEIAKVLLDKEYFIYGISRTKTKELKELENKFKNRIKIINFDLADSVNSKNLLLSDFINFKIPIYGFVNNAAIAYDDLITNINIQFLEKMYRVNVFTPFILTKYIIRNMLLHNVKGSIIHISSISAHTGYKGLAMYASTKGALEVFSKTTAREWGTKGIRSNSIVVGFMSTSMNEKLDKNLKDRIFQRTSLKMATSSLSVANTVEFLLSEKSESITGQNIFVDSGTI